LGHKASCPLAPIYNVENQVFFSLEKTRHFAALIRRGDGGTSFSLRLKKVSCTFQDLDLDEPL